jgi:hypothetical protein
MDVADSPDRLHVDGHAVAFTWNFVVRSGSIVFSYEMDRVITIDDVLALHGHIPWPESLSGSLTLSQAQSLCGECFAVPSIATVIGAYCLQPWGPWWAADPDVHDD